MKRSSGYTLIEMIVVMTAGTVLMGIALALLCALLRAEGTGRALVARSTSLSRLAEQFRRDAHASDQAANGIWKSPGKDGLTFRVTSPDAAGTEEEAAPIRSVEYHAEGSAVERSEWTGETLSGRDLFDLGEGYAAKFEIVRADGRQLARLAIVPNDASAVGNRRLQIEAALGWDHRFAEHRTGGK
jgi:prepilin-type N-terminal cleavage/methylation domain-containing protein